MEKRLTADLNVVANSNLEIQLLDGDLNIIQKLDDEPNDVGGLTSAELKAKFDESGNIIKKYINETLIPAVLTEDATEESRKQAEAARVAAEQGRVTAEEGRVSAETARAAAEQARSEAESSRVSAENAREAAETARADETAGIVARATAQANAAAGSASQAAGSEQSAKDAAGTATGAASSASQSAVAASGSASQAQASAAAAAQSAASVDGINKTAQSWAVGGTGTRPGEDTNNAKYWAEHAEAVAGGDFATKSEAQGYVTSHNESGDAHHDLRVAVAGSVRYDAAQTLSDKQKAQAQSNIGVTFPCNPNLLDNWYFGNPVNQRGQAEYTGNGYTIDRWFALLPDTVVTVQSGHVSIAPPASNYFGLTNLFEADSLLGQTVTFSALCRYTGSGGTMLPYITAYFGDSQYAGSAQINQTTWQCISFTITLPTAKPSDGRFGFDIVAMQNFGVDVKAVKLELGDRQTLAHKDASGNWVLNEVPDYGEQLRRCQRYYRQFNAYTKLIAQYIDGNRVVFVLPDSMRVAPVMSGAWRIYQGVSEQTGFTLNTQLTGNIIVVEATKENHGLQSAWLGVDVSGVGVLNAEL